MKIKKRIQVSRISRYNQIISTLIKYGFEDIASNPPLARFIPQDGFVVPKRNGKVVSSYTRNERIRLVCEELGTTFIKFAQIASNRPDLLSEDLIEELTKLQDSAQGIPYKEIESVLKSELPRSLDDFLVHIDEQPIATASIAQVHRATLLGGKEVVLKIQRPNIQKNILADIAIMKSLVRSLERFSPKYKSYNLMELIKMFEVSIIDELDFKLEAKNQEEFGRMFSSRIEVAVPKIYKELCTSNVICMEFVDGYKITNLEKLKELKITGRYIAETGINLYFEQVFDFGFFHADPHPGNIFVNKKGQIVFLDYGMMGTITDEDKILFSDILLSLHDKDVHGLKKAILKFAPNLSDELQRELEYDIINIIRNYSNTTIEDIDGNEVMKGLNSIFYHYKIKIPASLLLLIKALIIVEGVGLKLYPDYNIIENIAPYVRRLLEKKYNPSSLRRDLMRNIQETSILFNQLPSDLKDILEKIRTGKFHMEFEHKGLEATNNNLDVIANRISFTLIIVALLLSASIVIHADLPPKYLDIPILGVGALIIAFFFGIRLLFAILKHGKI